MKNRFCGVPCCSQWDIVSLLLDSKVCYPQLRNKAGYSPPMLAALAQPCNSTELQVSP